MSTVTIEPKRLQGEVTPPADKSISHRAIILGALAQGKTVIKNLSLCDDCTRTLEAFKQMGIAIVQEKGYFYIAGEGLAGLRKPPLGLYLGNSGTSMRLILGVLAGQDFRCELSGDESLSRRPMKRVTEPLTQMGAKISGKDEANFAPLTIEGGKLKPITYETPMASAQVKSAILLAGLYAEGQTKVAFQQHSRDHSERMLKKFGAHLQTKGHSVTIEGRAILAAQEIEVPGDISSASFFLAGASINPGSQVRVRAVGLNPTRTAFLETLGKMGAQVKVTYLNTQMSKSNYADEAVGEVVAAASALKGIRIEPQEVPLLIDELPIFMVVATQADGETVIRGAGELRVKETDRIQSMVVNLSRLGAQIVNEGNDIIIRGPTKLKGAEVESFLDHRTAMSMAIAGLVAQGPTTIKDVECVDISFPGFFNLLAQLSC
ncbi:MAG: 3-phosphoshikimate 1-carboxyvinyltransferase [Candidatus Omnitrophota bacterium]